MPIKDLIELWKGEGLAPICLVDNPTKVFKDNPTQYVYYLVGLLIRRSLIEVHDMDNGEYA
jgi:hypothetical protein